VPQEAPKNTAFWGAGIRIQIQIQMQIQIQTQMRSALGNHSQDIMFCENPKISTINNNTSTDPKKEATKGRHAQVPPLRAEFCVLCPKMGLNSLYILVPFVLEPN